MACSSCGKTKSALHVSVEKKALSMNGKKLVLPNGQKIQWVYDEKAKNKLRAVKLD